MTATKPLADTLARLLADALVGEYGPAQFATPSEVLAALLDGGAIREEWGVRRTWPDDEDGPGGIDEEWFPTEHAARNRHRHDKRVATDAQLIRRFVIVTAPTVVEEP